MQPQDWLRQFLTDRQLSKPNEQPLYRYRMNDDEFASLQEILKISALFSASHIIKMSGWNAAYVMYAADYWRRYYDGGAWSYEEIFASFAGNANEFNAEQRHVVVELGLKYWHRQVRVIHGRSCYLGTMATEGGLPVKQLNQVDYLSQLFKRAIPKYLRLYHADIADAIAIVGDYAHYLPENYQTDAIYAILGDMMCLVAQLKIAHQLANKDSAIDYLNQYVPEWQAQFPVPIDDPVALDLLTIMINTAVQAPTLTAPFCAKRLLHDDGVQLLFELADFIALEKITDTNNFPACVDIEIVSDDGNSYSVGVALKTTLAHKNMLKMPRCIMPPLQGDAVTQGYTLHFKQLANNLAKQPLIAAIDDSVPWVFVLTDDEWLLVGTASVNTAAEPIRILYPKHLICHAANNLELATLNDKHLIEASGVIELSDTAHRFCIQTAQAEAMQQYYLQGKRLHFSSTPNTVYLGVPELWCVNNDTEQRTKINTPLLAKAVNSNAAWQVLTTEQQGIYELCLQDEQGNIQFFQQCALLPENFTVHFLPLNGRVVIEHNERAYISCDSPFVSSIDIIEKDRSIEFNVSDTAPSDVDLILRWGRSDRLTLTVPFPIRDAQLIDANGNQLKQLFINQLHGVCVQLLGENHAHERHLTLEFSLKDASLNAYDLYFHDEVSKTGAVIKLALINYQQWIQELLAISHNPNSFVRLIVYELGIERLRTDIIRPVSLSSEPAITTRHVSTRNEITNVTDALTVSDDRLRQLFIRHQLKQLCLDFVADDWQLLREYQTDAPLNANEIWIAATLENRVLTTLVLQLDTAFMQRFEPELLVCWELIPVRDWLVVFTRYKNYLALVMEEADVKDIISNRIDKIHALSKSLNIVTQLLKVQLCADSNNEFEFMQTEDARLLITEQLEHEQQALTERQANSHWAEFLCDELFSYWQVLPPQTQHLLMPHDVKYHYGVILLPLLLAHFSLTAVPSAWQQSNAYLFKLRQLKVFDELWFTTAFTLLLAYLSQQPDYSQPLQQETATMINSDENDLVAEIEQQLALANQEVQGLQTDVQSLQGGEEALEALFLENQELNATIESLSAIIKKRDNALRLLLEDVKNLNTKIRDIRSELQVKSQ